MSSVDEVAAAIRSGGLALIPTDTVYGLACSPYREEPVRRLSELKGRPLAQPVALLAASVDTLLVCVPELRGRAGVLARALLPGPYTLVLPNPAHRYPWLTGERLDAIGVRVPEVVGPGRQLLDAVGALAATSANLHGGPDPRSLDEVPAELLAEAAALDGGPLTGVPSTVLDLTGAEPRVLREGAVATQDALARVAAVFSQ